MGHWICWNVALANQSASSKTSEAEEARSKKNQAGRFGCRRDRVDGCRDGTCARDSGCLIEEAVLKAGDAYGQGEIDLIDQIKFASGVLNGIKSCPVELDKGVGWVAGGVG